jgi:hypothetical protein
MLRTPKFPFNFGPLFILRTGTVGYCTVSTVAQDIYSVRTVRIVDVTSLWYRVTSPLIPVVRIQVMAQHNSTTIT